MNRRWGGHAAGGPALLAASSMSSSSNSIGGAKPVRSKGEILLAAAACSVTGGSMMSLHGRLRDSVDDDGDYACVRADGATNLEMETPTPMMSQSSGASEANADEAGQEEGFEVEIASPSPAAAAAAYPRKVLAPEDDDATLPTITATNSSFSDEALSRDRYNTEKDRDRYLAVVESRDDGGAAVDGNGGGVLSSLSGPSGSYSTASSDTTASSQQHSHEEEEEMGFQFQRGLADMLRKKSAAAAASQTAEQQRQRRQQQRAILVASPRRFSSETEASPGVPYSIAVEEAVGTEHRGAKAPQQSQLKSQQSQLQPQKSSDSVGAAAATGKAKCQHAEESTKSAQSLRLALGTLRSDLGQGAEDVAAAREEERIRSHNKEMERVVGELVAAHDEQKRLRRRLDDAYETIASASSSSTLTRESNELRGKLHVEPARVADLQTELMIAAHANDHSSAKDEEIIIKLRASLRQAQKQLEIGALAEEAKSAREIEREDSDRRTDAAEAELESARATADELRKRLEDESAAAKGEQAGLAASHLAELRSVEDDMEALSRELDEARRQFNEGQTERARLIEEHESQVRAAENKNKALSEELADAKLRFDQSQRESVRLTEANAATLEKKEEELARSKEALAAEAESVRTVADGLREQLNEQADELSETAEAVRGAKCELGEVRHELKRARNEKAELVWELDGARRLIERGREMLRDIGDERDGLRSELAEERTSNEEAKRVHAAAIASLETAHAVRIGAVRSHLSNEAELRQQLVGELSRAAELLEERGCDLGAAETKLAKIEAENERANERVGELASVNDDTRKLLEELAAEKAAALSRVDVLTEEKVVAQSQVKALAGEKSAALSQVEALTEEKAAIQSQVQASRQRCTELQSRLEATTTTVDELREDLGATASKLTALAAEQEQADDRVRELATGNEDMSKLLEKVTADKAEALSQVGIVAEEKVDVQSQVEASRLQCTEFLSRLEATTAISNELREELGAAASKLTALTAEKEQVDDRVRELVSGNEDMSKLLEDVTADKAEALSWVDIVTEEKAAVQSQVEASRLQCTELRSRLAATTATSNELREELGAAASKLTALTAEKEQVDDRVQGLAFSNEDTSRMLKEVTADKAAALAQVGFLTKVRDEALAQVDTLSDEKAATQSRVEALTRRHSEAQGSNTKLEAALAAAKGGVESQKEVFEARITKLEDEWIEARSRLEAAEVERDAEKARFGAAHAAELLSARAELNEVIAARAEESIKVDALRREHADEVTKLTSESCTNIAQKDKEHGQKAQELREKIVTLEEDLSRLASEAEAAKAEAKVRDCEHIAEAQAREDELQTARAERSGLEATIVQLLAEKDRTMAKLVDTTERYDAATAKLHSLTEEVDHITKREAEARMRAESNRSKISDLEVAIVQLLQEKTRALANLAAVTQRHVAALQEAIEGRDAAQEEVIKRSNIMAELEAGVQMLSAELSGTQLKAMDLQSRLESQRTECKAALAKVETERDTALKDLTVATNSRHTGDKLLDEAREAAKRLEKKTVEEIGAGRHRAVEFKSKLEEAEIEKDAAVAAVRDLCDLLDRNKIIIAQLSNDTRTAMEKAEATAQELAEAKVRTTELAASLSERTSRGSTLEAEVAKLEATLEHAEADRDQAQGVLLNMTEQRKAAVSSAKKQSRDTDELRKELCEQREAQAEEAMQKKHALQRAATAEGKQKKMNAIVREAEVLEEANRRLHQVLRVETERRKALHDAAEEAKGKIRVYVRIRPLSSGELKRKCEVSLRKVGNGTCLLSSGKDQRVKRDRSWDFTGAFGGLANEKEGNNTQEAVFRDTARPLITSAVDGFNVCIFAYGQTGSGKTYTMFGPGGRVMGDEKTEGEAMTNQDSGLAPRTAAELFRILHEKEASSEVEVTVTMFELHNDALHDLLACGEEEDEHHRPNLRIKLAEHSESGMVEVHDAVRETVQDAAGLLAVFQRGADFRTTASTEMNADSSRSHLITSIVTKVTNKASGKAVRGKLTLVDLAGSERMSKSGVSGDQMREAQSINKSLSALGDVIGSLTSIKGGSKKQHVPYRNHPLTMLMSDSLGGTAKTLMFVCCSPADYNRAESANSLDFASRLKLVKNKLCGPTTTAAVDKPARPATTRGGTGGTPSKRHTTGATDTTMRNGGGGVGAGTPSSTKRPSSLAGRRTGLQSPMF